MRILFLHGLESPPVSDKSIYLSNEFIASCPAIDYTDETTFDKILNHVKEFKPDFLIGSSMGGRLAYAISSNTGIPCLLFNPAIHNKYFNHKVEFPLGTTKFFAQFVLGEFDKLVDPEKTILHVKENLQMFEGSVISIEKISHRIPLDIFTKNVKLFKFNLQTNNNKI